MILWVAHSVCGNTRCGWLFREDIQSSYTGCWIREATCSHIILCTSLCLTCALNEILFNTVALCYVTTNTIKRQYRQSLQHRVTHNFLHSAACCNTKQSVDAAISCHLSLSYYPLSVTRTSHCSTAGQQEVCSQLLAVSGTVDRCSLSGSLRA